MKPEDIEKESFRIILSELGAHSFNSAELPIVQRVIHATADFEYAKLIKFSPNAIQNGVAAFRNGCRVITDVQMVATGINRKALDTFGGQIYCQINDPRVAILAQQTGKTRSEVAIRQYAQEIDGAVVAIGNAPTALFEILRLLEDESIRPALVVGVPVGFVNAVESKEALAQSPLNFITTTGRKGGSTVAVAIVNALLRLAGE